MAKTKLGKQMQEIINSVERIIVDGKKAIANLNEMTREAKQKQKPEDKDKREGSDG